MGGIFQLSPFLSCSKRSPNLSKQDSISSLAGSGFLLFVAFAASLPRTVAGGIGGICGDFLFLLALVFGFPSEVG